MSIYKTGNADTFTRAEFVDSFMKNMRRDLIDRLPDKGLESTMLGKTRLIINGKIDHIQFSIAQRKDGE